MVSSRLPIVPLHSIVGFIGQSGWLLLSFIGPILMAGLLAAGPDAANAEEPNVEKDNGATIKQRAIDDAAAGLVRRRADQITAGEPEQFNRLGPTGKVVPNIGLNVTGARRDGSSGTTESGVQRQLDRARSSNAAATGHRKSDDGDLAASDANGAQGLDGTVVAGLFNVWVEGKWLKIDANSAPTSLGLFFIGADYRINNDLAFGFLAQFDRARQNDGGTGSSVDSSGWMVGPYVVARLNQGLVFDARVSGGRSDGDIASTGFAAGDAFTTERWLARGQLAGDFKLGRVHLAPLARVLYYEERVQHSAGVGGTQALSFGRLTFGPKFYLAHKAADKTVITPFITLKGIWDFASSDGVKVPDGSAVAGDDFRGRFEAGASFLTLGRVSISGEGFYDGIGTNDFKAYGGSARVIVPLQ